MQQEPDKKLPVPPLGQLDYDRLAALNLTGGQIQNAALNAAFMAAHLGTSVTMPLILDAASAEVGKPGRPINAMEFKWVEPGKPAPPTPEATTQKGIPVPA